MSKNDGFIVSLDIGSSVVRSLVAKVDGDTITFVGKGEAENNGGISSGIVVDLEKTTKAIRAAVQEAEKVANTDVRTVVIGLSNEHVSYINSQGIVTVRGKEIVQMDIDRVMEQARNIGVSSDKGIIGVEIQEFVVDGQEGIQNPRGMSAQRLEVKVHIVMASESVKQNLLRAVNNADLNVDSIVINAIADSYAILDTDERKLGVALIDIGHGTTDIILLQDGSPFYTAVLPIGGEMITRDLGIMFHIAPHEAEEIKVTRGNALVNWVDENEEVTITVVGSREQKIKKAREIAEVIQPRVEEMLKSIRDKISEGMKKRGLTSIAVLTGGTSNLKNVRELAKDVLKYEQIRIGHPTVTDDGHGLAEVLKKPEYATAVGIIKYMVEQRKMNKQKKRGNVMKFIKNFFE